MENNNLENNASSEPTRWQSLLASITAAWPPQRFRDVGVVLGVSGGADSVALLRAIEELRHQVAMQQVAETSTAKPPGSLAKSPQGFLVVAHFNHGLRGQESDQDQNLVEKLADQFDASIAIGQPASPAADEATMSHQRMDFFIETAKRHGARYIALAHSRDDNIETVIHHLLRGTGPAGLAGIGAFRQVDQDLVLVRPMLAIPRQTIRGALTELGQIWREDSSNQSSKYTRNWIRNELMPKVRTRFPDSDQAIARAIEGQAQWRSVIATRATQWLEKARITGDPVPGDQASHVGTETHQFRLQALAAGEKDKGQLALRPVIIEAMQQHWRTCGWPRGSMAQNHWNRLADAIMTPADSQFDLPGEVRVTSAGELMTLRRAMQS